MRRSTTDGCSSRQGKPLRAYPNRGAAEEAAHYAQLAYGSRMVAYGCKRCERWHLCPADRHTPSRDCDECSKRAYLTEQGATRRAKIIENERGWLLLRVYCCPHGNGWHLTSQP